MPKATSELPRGGFPSSAERSRPTDASGSLQGPRRMARPGTRAPARTFAVRLTLRLMGEALAGGGDVVLGAERQAMEPSLEGGAAGPLEGKEDDVAALDGLQPGSL